MKRKILLISLALLLTISLVAIGCPAPAPAPPVPAPPVAPTPKPPAPAPPKPAPAPIVIKASHGYPTTHFRQAVFEHFAELCNKYLAGRVEVKIYPASQLYKSTKEIEAISMGAIQLTQTPIGQFASVSYAWNFWILPWFFSSYDEVFAIEDHPLVGGWFLKSLEAVGVKGLGFIQQGRGILITRVPVESSADLQGIKLRVPAGDIYVSYMKALGTSPIQMASAEVFTALQAGMVDGVRTTYKGCVSGKWHEAAPYILPCDMSFATSCMIAPLGWWNKLPADIRDTLESKVIPETIEWARKEIAGAEDEAIATMKADGAIFIPFTGELFTELRAMVQPTYDEYGPKIGEELIKRAQKKINEIRAGK